MRARIIKLYTTAFKVSSIASNPANDSFINRPCTMYIVHISIHEICTVFPIKDETLGVCNVLSLRLMVS